MGRVRSPPSGGRAPGPRRAVELAHRGVHTEEDDLRAGQRRFRFVREGERAVPQVPDEEPPSPSSRSGGTPLRSRSTVRECRSTARTSRPHSARQTPVVRPTWPASTMATSRRALIIAEFYPSSAGLAAADRHHHDGSGLRAKVSSGRDGGSSADRPSSTTTRAAGGPAPIRPRRRLRSRLPQPHVIGGDEAFHPNPRRPNAGDAVAVGPSRARSATSPNSAAPSRRLLLLRAIIGTVQPGRARPRRTSGRSGIAPRVPARLRTADGPEPGRQATAR